MPLKTTPPLTLAVGSGRPAKLNGVAWAVGRLHPTLPVLIEHGDGSIVRIEPRIPSPFARSRAPIVVASWPTELQNRGIGVDAEPVGREKTESYAHLRLDIMREEHDCSAVNGLIAIESGRFPREAAPGQDPRRLDPVRDMRDDVAVIAIEGMGGRRMVFFSAPTLIPIIVEPGGEATDPVVGAMARRRDKERALEEGLPWTSQDEGTIESGWHVREALHMDHDRFGQSWQSALGPAREELIAAAIARNWDPTLVRAGKAVGRAVEEELDDPAAGGIGL